eukprot:CAMPEP_0167809794 /NCGR_PEP_ID=MMETSP0111_2-20121227/24005_1 /TAXON_ID=91324 /ORGANISM="Lotharella globosa, Strain CCCM811" /LENGTH=65 /DNA_ID=CAMNT_0007708245 /DNA_START=508 /DNA_END=705 /DNA_ORIENTATION=+
MQSLSPGDGPVVLGVVAVLGGGALPRGEEAPLQEPVVGDHEQHPQTHADGLGGDDGSGVEAVVSP